jgi:hypothetical protein
VEHLRSQAELYRVFQYLLLAAAAEVVYMSVVVQVLNLAAEAVVKCLN